ncbi:MAG: nucleoside hydrolase [Bacteroidales bacterium]
MKKFLALFLAVILNFQLHSHPWKPSNYVIIDTDAGIDDIRAICLLLASPDVRVLAISVSSGILSPDNAYIKIKSLLNSFYHEGIPVGINRNNASSAKNLAYALNYEWGNEKNIDPGKAPDYLKVISDILKFEESKITFICLGSLNSADNAIKTIPGFPSRIKNIVWSSNGLNDAKGFNYAIDSKSAMSVLKSTVKVITVKTSDNRLFYTDDLLSEIDGIKNLYSEKVKFFMQSSTAKNHSFAYEINDELIPVYLHYPDIFRTTLSGNNSECVAENLSGISEGYLKILRGETVNRNQVFKKFPVDSSFYYDDVSSYVSEIISKYGMEEWQSGVLASEMHRHLGVYAIIGVKMGIRAREYFNTGVDEFEVVSWAGSVSPLSCMNDGIQLSTGATPGHGLLTVKNDSPAPVVDFSYLNKKIRISLNPEINQKIAGELKELNFVYGLDSNIYWELVREKAIKYWRDFDRHDIFIIEEL